MDTSKTRINLRTKQIDGDKLSLYLDYYHDGKRVRESLHLYLLPETNAKNIASNKKTMKLAEAKQAERLQELVATENSLDVDENVGERTNSDSSFTETKVIDYLKAFVQKFEQKGQKKNAECAKVLLNVIRKYRGTKLLLSQVDAEYCDKLVDFLIGGYVTQFGTHLKMTSARVLIYLFSRALNEAVEEGLMKFNPFVDVTVHDRITNKKPEKHPLSIDEIKALMDTQCPVLGRPQVKQAYLLAIFTGLTREDLRNLSWKDIKEKDGQMFVESTIRKVSVPLSDIAKRWLPVTSNRRGLIFKGLPKTTETTNVLRKWQKASGVETNLTFMVARNTFANLLLNTGADTETVCTLMGVSPKWLRQYKAVADYKPATPQEQLEEYYYSVYKRTDI